MTGRVRPRPDLYGPPANTSARLRPAGRSAASVRRCDLIAPGGYGRRRHTSAQPSPQITRRSARIGGELEPCPDQRQQSPLWPTPSRPRPCSGTIHPVRIAPLASAVTTARTSVA